MKTIILAAALGLGAPAWAQAPATEAKKVSVQKAKAKKATAKRHQDARHCLQRTNNDAIIRCAEEYL